MLNPSRHAELVSASVVERQTLKRVQGDEQRDPEMGLPRKVSIGGSG
jgi:hypothetical protein